MKKNNRKKTESAGKRREEKNVAMKRVAMKIP